MKRQTKCAHRDLDTSLRCKACGVPVDVTVKRNKYGARRTNGFHSAKEARRFEVLKLRPDIRELKCQPEFELIVEGQLICKYRGDFGYMEEQPDGSWKSVTEDVKSEATKTAVYKIKRALMRACYGIEVKET